MEPTGDLRLRIGVSGQRSVAVDQFHTRALKVIRPHYLDDSGQVFYIIVNPGGGYVGGDYYRMDIGIDPGASALLSDQAATKVYRTPGCSVVQDVDFRISAGATLEYIPNPLILYEDAEYAQNITVEIEPDSSVFLSEIITPGWSPDGRRFSYREARLKTVINLNTQPLVVDNLRLVPSEESIPVAGQFYLGGCTHLASAICLDPHVTEEVMQNVIKLVRDSGLRASVSRTDCPGFILRALGTRSEDLMSLILAAANLVRYTSRGQGAIDLRQN